MRLSGSGNAEGGGAVAGKIRERRETGEGGAQPRSWADELRNALAFAFFAAVYAIFGGWLQSVRPAAAGDVARGFGVGYSLAVLVFAGTHAAAWATRGLLAPGRRPLLLPLAAPLASLIAATIAVPRLFRAPDLAALAGAAAFVGAALAFSTAHDFYTDFQRQLVPARRIRDLLARHPAIGRWLLRWIASILTVGRLIPWLVGAGVLLALPSPLRARLAAYVLVLTLLANLINQKLLEELAVWAFLHALRAGDYVSAASLPIRAPRLAAEIAAAPADMAAPFAGYLAWGMEGPERIALAPAALSRLIPGYLGSYGMWGRGEGLGVGGQAGEYPPPVPASLLKRLLERGVRFQVETDAPAALEPLSLPGWSELVRREARDRLAALSPGEPLWQTVLRWYETPIRGTLLPLSLAWLPLLVLALVWVDSGPWALLLIGAALSFGLLLWLAMVYGRWIFDQSLRRHDFAFLARQLGLGKMRGELEDALGSRDAPVRDRAVELLLFDDEIARLGITIPAGGLRRFVKRVG